MVVKWLFSCSYFLFVIELSQVCYCVYICAEVHASARVFCDVCSRILGNHETLPFFFSGAADQSKRTSNDQYEDEKEDETIHELPEDETNQGNLDDENESSRPANEHDFDPEGGKPEDMELPEDLSLDGGSDQEGGTLLCSIL